MEYAFSEPQRLQGRWVTGLGPRALVIDHPRGSLAAAALPIVGPLELELSGGTRWE